MQTRLSWIGMFLLASGVTVFMMSFLGLYRLDSELCDSSDYLLVDSNSTGAIFPGARGRVQTGDMKQVEVIVVQAPFGYDSVWGETVQLVHPFEIALESNAAGQMSSFATGIGLAAGPVGHIFDFPYGWTSLDEVLITNPESKPVAVTVTVIFHRQVMDRLWLGILCLGGSLAVIGAFIVEIAIYENRRKLPEQ